MEQSQALEVERSTDDFMVERKWRISICRTCGKTFYSKKQESTAESSCGWRACARAGSDFRKLSKRHRLVKVTQIMDLMRGYFGKAGFVAVSPKNIVNNESGTDLIIAGVQILDDVIWHGRAMPANKVFIAQPCVRMQFQSMVGAEDGVSTSFVNVCTERAGITIREHLLLVDLWFGMLSKLGMHMNDVVVVKRIKLRDWGTGPFHSLELFFLYGGLELGDASYFEIPKSSGGIVSVSDIGFGLERILWALNKTDFYFDPLMPWAALKPREMHDFCRTIALLALCGVEAGNKGPGLQFKRLCRVLSEKYYCAELYEAVSYYYDYWKRFMEPVADRGLSLRRIRLEVDRLVNVKVGQILKLPPSREETTEEYFERLVYANGASINDLRQALRSCLT